MNIILNYIRFYFMLLVSFQFQLFSILLLPFQILSLIRQYIVLVLGLTVHQDVTLRYRVRFLYFSLAFYSLDQVYLWYVSTSLSPLDHLRHFDGIPLLTGLPFIYLVWWALVLMLLYFLYILLTVKLPFLKLLDRIFFQKENHIVEGITLCRIKCPMKISQKILCTGANAVWPIIIIGDCVVSFSMAMTIILSINQIYQQPSSLFGNPLQTPLTFTWNLLRFLLLFPASTLIPFLYNSLFLNTVVLSGTILYLLYLRQKYTERHWPGLIPNSGQFTWTPFTRYIEYSTRTFAYVFIVNDPFGRLFVAFLVANLPASAFIAVRLALGIDNHRKAITLVLIMGQGVLGCMVLQWLTVKATKRLHAPAKKLLALMATTRHRVGNCKARLSIYLTICRLHTNAQYGITYGTVSGTVTLDSFLKCTLLYGQLIIYAYKLIRDI